MKTQVVDRFPGHEHKAVGGFVFLRLICPAIVSPHVFGKEYIIINIIATIIIIINNNYNKIVIVAQVLWTCLPLKIASEF